MAGAALVCVSWGMNVKGIRTLEPINNNFSQQIKPGEKVFKEHCASCHQLDGGGVPHLAPPLIETKYVLGDKAGLIHIVLNGLNEDIEINNEHFTNPMPPFSSLSDKDIANVLTYVRSSFGNKASAVAPAEVKVVRSGGHDKK